MTVYVGNEIKEFDAGVENTVRRSKKKRDEFWVTYAGTIGTSYDIRTLVLTGEELIRRRRLNIKIKILGGGPLEEATGAVG